MNYSKDANTKKQKTKKATKKKVKNRVGLIIMRVTTIIIILIFFAVLGAGMGAYLGILDGAPDISLLQVEPNKYTSYIYDQNGTEIDTLHGIENRIHVTLDGIPLNMQNATVAIEDERFYSHTGIDFQGMVRALFVNIESALTGKQNLEGASTITQQLIKSAFFKDALVNKESTTQKFTRKLQEQYMAIQLENLATELKGSKKAGKDQILELYLNTINYHGANGVQAAAKRYFSKDASELTLAECAMLAAIPQNPSKWNPTLHPDSNKIRQTTVLDRMLKQGFITDAEYKQAIDEDVYSKIQIVAQEVAEEKSSHTYYTDQLINSVIEGLQEQEKLSLEQANDLIYSGGLQIYSAQDLEIQKIVDEAYKNPKLFPNEYALEVSYYISVEDKITKKAKHYPVQRKYVSSQEEADAFALEMRNKCLTDDVNLLSDRTEVVIQPQSAFVVTDYHTGEVKALIGGRGEKTGSRLFNRATQATRQPGSTFKVLAAYAPGLDTGLFTPATVFNDAPYTRGGWSPGNWYSGYKGLNTVRSGIAQSMNILAAKAIAEVGITTSMDYLKNFGFTTLVDQPQVRGDGKTYSDLNDSVALGGLTDGVILSELNSAYGTIANGGEYLKPIYYTKVLKHDGTVLLENKIEPKVVLKKTTAFLLTDMMEDVVTSSIGTGKAAKFKNLNMPIAGKTGTTSETKDLVFAGYTPYYVASVWLGHDQKRNLIDNGNTQLYLWSDIMEKIHLLKNLENKKFEQPEGIISKNVCNVSGKLPVDGLCNNEYSRGSRVISEYFDSSNIPTEKCDVHISVRVDVTTNSLATEYCPSDYIAGVVRIKRPSDGSGSASDSKYYAPTNYCGVHDGSAPIPTEEETTNPEEVDMPPIVDEGNTGTSKETTTYQPKEATTSQQKEATTSTKKPDIPITNKDLKTPLTIDDFYSPVE